MAWLEISDAIAESAMTMKRYYDQGRKPIFFSVGDKVYLHLHKGYSIPSATNWKLGLQRAGPFKIIERIGRLAYRLQIPDHWRVYNVFAIDHLELATPGDDPFLCSRPDLPGPVHVEGDTECSKSYEIERLVDKHVTPTGRVKYLLRWKGWGPEYDEWRSLKQLQNAKELVAEYEADHAEPEDQLSDDPNAHGIRAC